MCEPEIHILTVYSIAIAIAIARCTFMIRILYDDGRGRGFPIVEGSSHDSHDSVTASCPARL